MHHTEYSSKPIQVTKAFLPPFQEYVERLQGIWDRGWLTNNGPLLLELEEKLKVYHGLATPVHCLTNGALGLQIALKAMGVRGEVITTPFSYVATTACPLWEGCTVKFADIEPSSLTIDPMAVEAAITTQTEAIMATHVFGNPCDVEVLERIAEKYGLALIFDAAHAFGVRINGKSILEYGDISMVSLHATKLFHTIEGGFVVATNSELSGKMEWMRRFGHKGLDDFYGVGINAKMNEFQAAMGLCNLQHIDYIMSTRRNMVAAYHEQMSSALSVKFAFDLRKNTEWNNAYYPVLFDSENELLEAMDSLASQKIVPRRYFYPSLEQIFSNSTSRNDCPRSKDIASRIMCLPLFASDDLEFIQRIFSVL